MNAIMRFDSKIDWWVYLSFMLLSVVMLGTLVPLAFTGHPSLIPLGIAAVFGLGLPLWLLLSTHYRIADNRLYVKSGPFSWNIPIEDIQSAKPSRSLLSGPALSLDRLNLIYGKSQSLVVSPKDKVAFLAAIGHTTSTKP